MKKRKFSIWILLCIMFLFVGCQESGEPERQASSNQQKRQKTDPRVRAAFTEETEPEDMTETETEEIETEETEENTEPEDITETETETEEAIDAIVASEETYDYVALGNSVTCNETDGTLWWGNWGMAASTAEKDYVHLISIWLQEQLSERVTTTVLDLKNWEIAQNRDGILEFYKEYFNEHTDLVTIQTGENITEFKETLDMDYLNLVEFIRESAPNAQILMLGELLWPSEDIEASKRAACAYNGITFVDMAEFLNGYESFYKSFVGAEVSGADGESYTISNEVVAAHPNDEGMACIAQQVIEQITINR